MREGITHRPASFVEVLQGLLPPLTQPTTYIPPTSTYGATLVHGALGSTGFGWSCLDEGGSPNEGELTALLLPV